MKTMQRWFSAQNMCYFILPMSFIKNIVFLSKGSLGLQIGLQTNYE